jgi:DNA-binding CsgD family transcriptional regulator
MTDEMLQRCSEGREFGASPLTVLTDRELEVVQRIGRGQSTRQIAIELSLSVKTVETYRERIKDKLGLKNGMELVQHAVRWRSELETES